MRRLFTDFLCRAGAQTRRIRGACAWTIAKCAADVQADVAALWPEVTTENLREVSEFAEFQREFPRIVRL